MVICFYLQFFLQISFALLQWDTELPRLGFWNTWQFIWITSGSNNDMPPLWTVATVSLLVGQVLIVVAMFKKDRNRYGQFGIIGLTIAVLSMFYALPEQVWYVSLLTSAPFLTLSIIFFIKSSQE